MTELKYLPVIHDHEAFLAQAGEREGFKEAYEALELEYAVANQMLKARSRAGLTQDMVAERMGTTKSAISRLESAGKTTDGIFANRCKRPEGPKQNLQHALHRASWTIHK